MYFTTAARRDAEKRDSRFSPTAQRIRGSCGDAEEPDLYE
jgi:hypothetical protein